MVKDVNEVNQSVEKKEVSEVQDTTVRRRDLATPVPPGARERPLSHAREE
jgi:hypothetical protein